MGLSLDIFVNVHGAISASPPTIALGRRRTMDLKTSQAAERMAGRSRSESIR
jgi:hypothetical protein